MRSLRDQSHFCFLVFLSNPPPSGVLSLGIACVGAGKAPVVGASQEKEETTMKLITHFELATRSTSELHALYREIFNALVRSAPGSDERRNCLASLENVRSEMRNRLRP